MNYFNRLTDIVTVNLTSLLTSADDPGEAIDQIVTEIRTGLDGAERSVGTARRNEQKVLEELSELSHQLTVFTERARAALSAGNESEAREALERKQEVIDLVAGLEQQLQAAIATREQLETTQKALKARLAEAERRQRELREETSADTGSTANHSAAARFGALGGAAQNSPPERRSAVDAELDALRRELGNGG